MLARSREQRKSLRRFTSRVATLSLGVGKPPINCVICDISDGGARLAVELPFADLPHQFILNLFKDGSVGRNCELVWTDERFVGVRFTGLLP
jgi:hypothetical protein